MPVTADKIKSRGDTTEDGLPVLKSKGRSAETTEDGLPILKKKDDGSKASSASQSALPDTKILTQTPTTIASESKSDLHDNIFGKTVKPFTKIGGVNVDINKTKSDEEKINEQKREDTASGLLNADVTSVADTKESAANKAEATLLAKTKSDKEREIIHQQKSQLTKDFFNGEISGDDIQFIKGGLNLSNNWQHGLTNDQIAGAINNKTKNLRDWRDAALNKGMDNYAHQKAVLEEKIQIEKNAGNNDTVTSLENQKKFLEDGLTKMYEAEKQKVVPKLIDDMRNSIFGSKSWEEIYDENKSDRLIRYNKTTGALTKESVANVLGWIDGAVSVQQNKVLDVGATGDVQHGNVNYSDIGKQVVDYLNTVVPVKHSNKNYSTQFGNENPKFKPLIDNIEKLNNYFTLENNRTSDAYQKAFVDKQTLINKQKYWGEGGVMVTNPAFVKIQHRYAEDVANGIMSEDVAKKQIQSEIEQSPELKKILSKEEEELNGIRTAANKMKMDYIVNGVKSTGDPNLIVFPDGNIGVRGLTEEEAQARMGAYNSGLIKNTAETIAESQKILKHEANLKARTLGAFQSSLEESADNMAGAFYKWYFDQTGIGGADTRMYQAQAQSEIPASQSEEAQTWKSKAAWDAKGITSFLDWKYYLAHASSVVGSTLPVIAPSVVAAIATEGASLPESMSWLASAGVFTVQDMQSSFNDLVGSKDAFGNTITEVDAARASAKQAKEEFLPNLAMMGVNLGGLIRAKNLVKPTLIGGIKQTILTAAEGTVPMAVQGYLSYANQLEAKGLTPDMWDYVQDEHFGTSLMDGFIGGLGIQLMHAPTTAVKNFNNWKRLLHGAQGEFYDNSLFNIALQHEMDNNGNYFTDAAKLNIFSKNYKGNNEKSDLENVLLYSTALHRNVTENGIDLHDVNGAYQAHNLALADLHRKWAEENEANNPTIASIYSAQAKDFEKQARAAMEGKAKFHYLLDANDKPIFISDQAFKVLDQGQLREWFNHGLINDVVKSDDPDFGVQYKEKMNQKNEEQPKTSEENKIDSQSNRSVEEQKKILDEPIGKRVGRKSVDVDGKPERADIAIEKIKSQHKRISDLIDNCL